MEEAVGQALRTIGVALRTPIMTVSGSVQLALGSDDLEEVRRQLVAIESASDALSGIVGDLLDAAELASGTLQFHVVPFRLPDTIQEAVKAVAPLAEDRDLELTTHGLTALPTDLVGDPARLRQVLTHLIANAVAWTNRGRVQVGAQVLEQDPSSVSVRFAVRDTSGGLDPEELEEAFLPFGDAGPGVSVLGLSIARLVIELMGGSVEVTSSPGDGTVVGFTLEFPRANAAELVPMTPSGWVRLGSVRLGSKRASTMIPSTETPIAQSTPPAISATPTALAETPRWPGSAATRSRIRLSGPVRPAPWIWLGPWSLIR